MNTTLAANPLLTSTPEGISLFDQILPEHVEPAIQHLISESEQRLQQLEACESVSWSDIMTPLYQLTADLNRAWGAVQHLQGVCTTDALRAAYESMQPQVVQHHLRIGQSAAVYALLCGLRDQGDLNEMQQRVLTAAIREAEHAGVGLVDAQREQFSAIRSELAELSTTFSNHVLDATKAFQHIITDEKEIEGLPLSGRQLLAAKAKEAGHEAAHAESGPWALGLDAPSFIPVMDHVQYRPTRELLYRAFISRASSGDLDNAPLIERILELRREAAKILGFPSRVEESLATKMAPDCTTIMQLIDELAGASRPAAEKEHAELTQFAESAGCTEPLAHWDIAFWAERQREQLYSYSDEDVRPYFALPHVLAGLFDVCQQLFGITIRETESPKPLWHKDAQYFDVMNAAGDVVAGLYLDPYARPAEKRGGAWMDVCVQREQLADGSVRVPVAFLVCNGAPPVQDGKESIPSLMSFREVETLFHECGHGLQHILTTIDEPLAAGLANVEWDAIEIASQFMEYWAYQRETFFKMAKHYSTGESISEDLYERIVAARTYRAGWMMLRQLSFAKVDLLLHANDGSQSVADIEKQVDQEMALLSRLPENKFLCGFTHIFAGGYAAGYYSYKWSEVYAADCYAAFEEAGVDNPQAVAKVGAALRDTLFALGGSRDPLDVFADFRGRPVSSKPLLRHFGLI